MKLRRRKNGYFCVGLMMGCWRNCSTCAMINWKWLKFVQSKFGPHWKAKKWKYEGRTPVGKYPLVLYIHMRGAAFQILGARFQRGNMNPPRSAKIGSVQYWFILHLEGHSNVSLCNAVRAPKHESYCISEQRILGHFQEAPKVSVNGRQVRIENFRGRVPHCPRAVRRLSIWYIWSYRWITI